MSDNRKMAAEIARHLCASIGAQVAAMIEGGAFPKDWDGHEVRALLSARFAFEVSALMEREKARNSGRWRRYVRDAAEGDSRRHEFKTTAQEGALALLLDDLRQIREEKGYPPDPDDGHGFIGPDGLWTAERSPAAAQARVWCHALLEAAKADGARGCLLCKS